MKIKYVVFNEYALGFIMPHLPNTVQVLRDSVLKGAPWALYRDDFHIGVNDKIRLASEKDFDEYKVSFDFIKNPSKYDCFEYEYAN